MTWGARTVVCSATMVVLLLLQLATLPTAAPTQNPWVAVRSTNATAKAAADKRRLVGSDTDILIDHDDDAVVMMPLLVALVVFIALLFLMLLILLCFLLTRFFESYTATKYHRLHCSENSETYERRRHRSRTGRAKQSQVFTYVDLSNAECSCLEHGAEGEKQQQQQPPAPRFAVQFQSATKVDVNDGNAHRERQGVPAPAPRRSRMATMGLPSGEDDTAEDAQPMRRTKTEERNANPLSVSANAPSDRPVESPTLRMYAENAARGSPGAHGGDYVEEADEFDTYRERCAQLKSVVPQMEINIRDRCIKRHPSSAVGGSRKSPRKHSGADREIEMAVTTHMTESSSMNYPDLHISHPSELVSPHGPYDISSDNHSSPLFSPSGLVASAPASGSMSEHTSPFRAENSGVSGYGRDHDNRAYDEAGKATTKGVTQQQCPEVSSTSAGHRKSHTVASPSKSGDMVKALMELPDTRVSPRDGIIVKSSNSARLRELFEREAARARQADVPVRKPAEGSKPSLTPLKINTCVTSEISPSPCSSETQSPSVSSSKELAVQVPQMIAYFDRAQAGKPLKASFEETAESEMATRSPSLVASLTTPSEVEPPAPVKSTGKTMASTGRIKLPQPPIERSKKEVHVKLPDEELAARSESSQPPRTRHDDQSSTEPFSIDELSRQRASASEPFSDTDISSDHVDARKYEVFPPSVPPRSKSSFVSSDVQSSKDTVVSTVGGERSALSAVAEEREVSEQISSQLAKPDASPRRQSVDTYSKSDAPYARQDRESMAHADGHDMPSRDMAAVVSPFDSPESGAHISPETPSHVEKTSVAPINSFPLKEVDYTRPVAAKDNLMQPSAQPYVVVEGGTSAKVAQRGGDSETGINESVTTVSTQDVDFPRKQDMAPVRLSAKEDEHSLTLKQAFEFPLSSESVGMARRIEAHDAKENIISDLAQTLTSDQRNVVLDKENQTTLRDEGDLPASQQQEPITTVAGRRPDRQLVTDKGSRIIDEQQAHLPTEPTKAQSEVSEVPIVPHKRALIRTEEADKEHGEVTSSGVRNLEDRPVRQEVQSSTERPPAMYSAPPQMILRTSVPSSRNQTDAELAMRAEHKVPGETTEERVRDAVLAQEKQITSAGNETRLASKPHVGYGGLDQRVPHQVRTVSRDSQSAVGAYDSRRRSLSEISPASVPDRTTPYLQKDGMVLSHTEHEAPVDHNQIFDVDVLQTGVAGKQTGSANEPIPRGPTETYPRKSTTVAKPTALEQEAFAVKGSPLLSDQRGASVPSSRNQTDAALTMRAEQKVPGETTDERVKDVVLAQEKQITSVGNETRLASKPDVSLGGLDQRVPHQILTNSKDSQRALEEYDSGRRRLSETSPPSVPDRRAPHLQKDGMVLSRTEHDAPVDRNQAQWTDTDNHTEYIALDGTPRPSLGERLVKEPIAPSMQRPPVMSTTPPQMLLHGPIPNFWDETNATVVSRQEYRVPGETVGGPFKEVAPVHAKPVTSEKDQSPMTQDSDIGIGNLAQKGSHGIRLSDKDSGGPVAPYDSENRGTSEPVSSSYDSESRSISEPVPSSATQEWMPPHKRDDKVSSRAENGVPADSKREADIRDLRTELTDRHVGPVRLSTPSVPTETYSNTNVTSARPAAAEEEVIPGNQRPLLTVRDDKDSREVENASGPSLKDRPVQVSVPPSREGPPVMDIPPPMMLLHGPLPNLWGGKDALISRDEYTVPGDVTGGPFSAAGRGPSDDTDSPESPGPQFPADGRRNVAGSTAAEQKGNMVKTARRRSSWADSLPSRPPSVARSLHSSVELSHPTNGNISDAHSTTTFLSDTISTHEGGDKIVTPERIQSDVSRSAVSPVQGVVSPPSGEMVRAFQVQRCLPPSLRVIRDPSCQERARPHLQKAESRKSGKTAYRKGKTLTSTINCSRDQTMT
ncbi:hypothetical protein HPB49_008692 [Dermacentor silvarum]|uniref:Uncharacterized protein n=1 Tax=Dermacentor silvarum TaxID=543639 RepID=A0ACB8DBW8_DERSI|nr:hypothetical protein HPB49_008692 [Dermacentor silvarum]